MSRNPLLRFWFNLLFWSYGRGTWQYDLLCGAIIAFLFLTPTRVLFSGLEKDPTNPAQKIVGLQKIQKEVFLLLVLESESPKAHAELERRWQEFDGKTEHRFVRKAFYDDKGRILGYVLSVP